MEPKDYLVIGGNVCKGLKNDVNPPSTIVIPEGEGVTVIGNGAFMAAFELEKISLPSGLKKIEGEAFYHCQNLKTVEIPSTVDEIAGNAFLECSGLKSIVVFTDGKYDEKAVFNEFEKIEQALNSSASATNRFKGVEFCVKRGDKLCKYDRKNKTVDYSSIGNDERFEVENECFSKVKADYIETIVTAEIPNNTVKIGKEAFKNCSSLTSVNIPATVKEVEHNAFLNCSSLTKVDIPNNVTKIGTSAFQSCTEIESIKIPDSVTELGAEAFRYCSSLKKVYIGKGISKINFGTFDECDNLTKLTFSNSDVEIVEGAFSKMPASGGRGIDIEIIIKEGENREEAVRKMIRKLSEGGFGDQVKSFRYYTKKEGEEKVEMKIEEIQRAMQGSVIEPNHNESNHNADQIVDVPTPHRTPHPGRRAERRSGLAMFLEGLGSAGFLGG